MQEQDGSQRPSRVFISYSHESDGHRANILDIAQQLRNDRIDAWIDQYEESDPPLSWPAWMADEVDKADFVLLVFTETYSRRFSGREAPGVGLGARWEGQLITSDIYHAQTSKVKFIPVIISGADSQHVPAPLRLTTRYILGDAGDREGYASLLTRLRRETVVQPVPIASSVSSSHPAPPIGDTTPIQETTGEREHLLLKRLEKEDGIKAATTAYELGQHYQAAEQYTMALRAYQRALDFMPNGGIAEKAGVRMTEVLTTLNSHYGPHGPVTAAREWLAGIEHGQVQDVWPGIDANFRLVLAQAWIHANRDHPRVRGFDKAELAESLSRRAPNHLLAHDFWATQSREFQASYALFDADTWGAAEKPRRFGLDLELVIFMETRGEEMSWEADTAVPSIALIMRRTLEGWKVAGVDDRLAEPGWPPSHTTIPSGGAAFIPRN